MWIFFFKQKTAYEMRISDWSSDVCSSDLSAEPSSLDPHYHNLGPNNQIAYTIFDTLVLQDATQKLQPGLATSWKPTSDTTWEFKLRQGVKFHDGSPFTAKDVVFSIERPAKVPNSPSQIGRASCRERECQYV